MLQTLLQQKYKELLHREMRLPSFGEVQFRAFSQTGEDGILLYVFSLVGKANMAN